MSAALAGPTAGFTWEPSEGGIIGEADIWFTDTTSGGVQDPDGPPYYTYDWDFGDGTPHSNEGPDPFKHTYSQGGGPLTQNFTVTLTVTDFESNVDEYQEEIEVTFNS
jgi:hypothetical protein